MNPQIPLKDFFKNPERTSYEISPYGNHIAYLASWENRLNIFVQKVGEPEGKRITAVKDRDLAGFFWANNEMLVFSRDFEGDENFHLFTIGINGGVEKDITPFDKVRASVLDDLEDDDTNMIVLLNKRHAEFFDPYKINVYTGELTLLHSNPGNISSYITDQAGVIRAAITTDGVNNSFIYRADDKAEFKKIVTTNFKESLSPLFFDFDNKTIYASTNIGRDKSVIAQIDPTTGKEIKVLFEHPEVDVDQLTFSKKRKVLTSIRYTTAKREFKFLDEIAQKRYEKVAAQLPGYEVVFTSVSKNEDKFIARTYSDRSLGAYYLYDETSGKLTKLTDVSPWIDENQMAEMKPIKYTSRDGLTIHAYITIPKGSNGRNLPVVINPHGGPWTRDNWGFNPEVQFLANRGYAVLQMNFRGSTGYGRSFWESSFKQWGQNMQNDVTDGVQYLIKEGIADSQRVAIYGGSYGGYCTLAGVTLTPDLYCCAVDYVGVSNLFTFLKTIPPYWKPYLEMMYAMVGNPETDSVMLHNASPVFHVDKIKCPMLIAQGKMDPRVNVNESEQIVAALKTKNIPYEYILKENEGHGFHNEENRFEFYGAMEKFFDKYLHK